MQYATGGTNLADILERVLDRGVVIAGDVTVSLVEIELLTIKLRLVIASVDRAREIVIVKTSADYDFDIRDHETVEMFRAIAAHLDRPVS